MVNARAQETRLLSHSPGNDARLAVTHGLLLLALLVLPSLVPPVNVYPLRVLLPILVYAVVVACVSRLRRSAAWLRHGRLDARSAIAAVALGLVSISALVVWYALLQPDLSPFSRHIPASPVAAVAAFGCVFALLNAAVEEAIWRGVLMDALAVRVGMTLALMVQAVGFGVGHSHGIPSGALGMVMATAFGAALGALKVRSNGLFLPWLVHVSADATIFLLALHNRASV